MNFSKGLAFCAWLCAHAIEGVHALHNPNVEVGKGGVALCIPLEMAEYITKEGITDCNKAVGSLLTSDVGSPWIRGHL